MSGDNQYVSQPLKFYTEEMTETKRIAIAHLEKRLFPVANSVIYLSLIHISEPTRQAVIMSVPPTLLFVINSGRFSAYAVLIVSILINWPLIRWLDDRQWYREWKREE